MASCAVQAEAPIVAVVLPVAGAALTRTRGRLAGGRRVARVTRQVFVLSVQGKVGLFIVVKLPEAPPVRVVALGALRP